MQFKPHPRGLLVQMSRVARKADAGLSSHLLQLEGAGVELIVVALLGDELVVRAALDDASVIQG